MRDLSPHPICCQHTRAPRRAGRRLLSLALLCALLVMPAVTSRRAEAADGGMRWGLHVTLAPRWLDPADTEAFNTPFMVLYAVHDALVKPMPAGIMTPSLAESWQEAKDHLAYTFTLRKNARFHNGDPVTAEDVKFSFERYRRASAQLFKSTVKDVQALGPTRVRFTLKEPCTTASGAGWIAPKKYIWGVGPRVEEPGANLIPGFAYSAPFEDVKLKAQ